ncbi:MAG TPA: maleylpyruvate isomerase N-terminal domain-containing protein [Roseiflexaceae bacterium]|nr:maleylpyruvate isomerase N-terminal domain-containing protein [Roseiflexaceae bacterium]
MQPVGPIFTADLFPGLHAELITLLRGLAPADWERPTVAAGWTVRDMAAHLLDTDIRRLSFQRDGLALLVPPEPLEGYRDLVGWLDSLNAQWVGAARRISPRVLTDLLALTGAQMAELFATLDPDAPALGVAWAGEQQSAAWFDTAREYTEKWMHQQQIRDAVGAPLLSDRRWLFPALDTFLRGLPHTFAAAEAPEGTTVTLLVEGEAGGAWTLLREGPAWRLHHGQPPQPDALLALDQDCAWRLFTKGLHPDQTGARLAGDTQLAARALDLVAIMA